MELTTDTTADGFWNFYRLEVTTATPAELKRVVRTITRNRLPDHQESYTKPSRASSWPQGGVLESALGAVLQPLAEKVDTLVSTVTTLQSIVADFSPMGDRLWTYRQLAERCQVKVETVRGWAFQQKLATTTTDKGKTRIPHREAMRVIDNGCKP